MKRLLFILLFFPCLLYGQTTSIRVGVKDAMISSKRPTLNYGTATVATVGRDTVGGLDTLRYLIQSSAIVSAIPSNAVVDSFKIVLYQCSTATDTSIGTGWLYIRELDSTFVEGDSSAAVDTVNWKQKLRGTQSNVVNWKTPGGDFRAAKLDSQAFTAGTDSIVFRGDSLKALFRRYLAGTSSNKGFIISTNESVVASWVFATSDSTGRQPRWNVWYTIPSTKHTYDFWARDSSSERIWIPDTTVRVRYADSSGYAMNAVDPTIVDSSRLALDSDSLGGNAAVLFMKRAQIDSALVPKIDTTKARAMISDTAADLRSDWAADDNTVRADAGDTVRAILPDTIAMLRGDISDSLQLAQVTVEEGDGSPSGNAHVIQFQSLTVSISGDTATIGGSGSVGNADSLGGVAAAAYQVRQPGIITLIPTFPGESFSVLSADTAVSAAVVFGDSVRYRFYTSDEEIDSLQMSALIPIPADFGSFDADSALLINFRASGNSTDSSYLELDVFQYPATAELDSAKLAANGFSQILVKATSLADNAWTDDDILRLDFTVGVKQNHDVKIERVIMKYARK